MTDHTAPEPAPQQGHGYSLFDAVINDLESRRIHGLKTYGTTLESFNHRRSGIDAYQEQMDNLLYLKQLNIELDSFGEMLDRLTVKHKLDGKCCTDNLGDKRRLPQCTALAQLRITAIQIGLIRESS